MNNYICSKCQFKETDQIGDIICMNPDSGLYKQYVEEIIPKLDECEYFEDLKKEDK